VAGLMAMFRYLKYSLVLILAFVGVKMLLVQVYHVPNLVSLGIIVGTLAGGIFASLLATWREARLALQGPCGEG
jgi:tellurite resistance protein TerC